MKRFLDIVVAAALLAILAPVILLVVIAVRVTSQGPVLFRSSRIGRRNVLFDMYKFRTMSTGTPQVATHLMENPRSCLTPIGGVLRKSSLDEIPQLLNVLSGKMSLVGPRPALFNQEDLVALRTQRGIHELLPGITGWAQVNGRDELSIPAKVALDEEYLRRRSVAFDLRILFLTARKVFTGAGVSH